MLFSFHSSSARAQGFIRYELEDLTDEVPGEDLWEYTYEVGGYDFQMDQGFSVYFDHQLFANLHNPRPSPSALWDVLVVQPDVILEQPGFFDALALVNSPSTSDPFQVRFIWLGGGAPGDQGFEIYDSDFQPLVTGMSVVPEPGSGVLFGMGALLVWGYRLRRGRERREACGVRASSAPLCRAAPVLDLGNRQVPLKAVLKHRTPDALAYAERLTISRPEHLA